ncbi:ABC transporter [Seiridium cupressi]
MSGPEAMFVVSNRRLLSKITKALHGYPTFRFTIRLRGGLISLVQGQTVCTRTMDLGEITAVTLMETSVGAVSRVPNYATTTDPEENTTSLAPLPADWPSTGAIQLSGLVAGHSPSSPPVLKDMSMAIRASGKIAICGPSGSGKTSLILALLRMIEIQQGSITIDGANMSKHPRADVRLELSVVTQEPSLLTGTIRLNLDPFQSGSDEDIIRALQKLGPWDGIVHQGGLDMPMKRPLGPWARGNSSVAGVLWSGKARSLSLTRPLAGMFNLSPESGYPAYATVAQPRARVRILVYNG